ncbi:MAG: hypothetical protein Q9227_001598 [Pyrenula ochraceoflavens]
MAPTKRKASSVPEGYREDRSKGMMLRFEDSLPRLPVPTLEETAKRYLKSVHPLLNQDEYKNTEAAVKEFLKEGGQGQTLQKRLIARREDPQIRNWIIDWWNEAGYLAVRDPVVPYVSYFYSHRDDRRRRNPAKRAAAMTTAALDFKRQVDDGSLEPEYMRGLPLDMGVYQWMFNASRVPAEPVDYPVKFPADENQHIVVVRKNQFWKVSTHVGGTQLNTSELEQMYNAIYKKAEKSPAVGVLTAAPRDFGAKARHNLLSANPANADALKDIESSSFVVCLDDASPITLEERAHSYWHGDGCNRWFDKPCQFIINDNGTSGFMGEHSMMDGTTTHRLNDYANAQIFGNRLDFDNSSIRSNLPDPVALRFHIDSQVQQDITTANAAFDQVIAQHELRVQAYQGYGKALIKKFKCSPDAYVQMLIQLAYHKMYGKNRPTYESAATRKFQQGRTEAIRSVSAESVAFCDAMADPNIPPEKCEELFRKAISAHIKYIAEASDGRGVDRHLFGLKKLIQPGEKTPSIFTDPTYGYSSTWFLSTSQLSSEYFNGYGWSQVVDQGWGIAYMINENSMNNVHDYLLFGGIDQSFLDESGSATLESQYNDPSAPSYGLFPWSTAEPSAPEPTPISSEELRQQVEGDNLSFDNTADPGDNLVALNAATDLADISNPSYIGPGILDWENRTFSDILNDTDDDLSNHHSDPDQNEQILPAVANSTQRSTNLEPATQIPSQSPSSPFSNDLSQSHWHDQQGDSSAAIASGLSSISDIAVQRPGVNRELSTSDHAAILAGFESDSEDETDELVNGASVPQGRGSHLEGQGLDRPSATQDASWPSRSADNDETRESVYVSPYSPVPAQRTGLSTAGGHDNSRPVLPNLRSPYSERDDSPADGNAARQGQPKPPHRPRAGKIFQGFPTLDAPLPVNWESIAVRHLVRNYPNHLHGEVIRHLLAQGYRDTKIRPLFHPIAQAQLHKGYTKDGSLNFLRKRFIIEEKIMKEEETAGRSLVEPAVTVGHHVHTGDLTPTVRMDQLPAQKQRAPRRDRKRRAEDISDDEASDVPRQRKRRGNGHSRQSTTSARSLRSLGSASTGSNFLDLDVEDSPLGRFPPRNGHTQQCPDEQATPVNNIPSRLPLGFEQTLANNYPRSHPGPSNGISYLSAPYAGLNNGQSRHIYSPNLQPPNDSSLAQSFDSPLPASEPDQGGLYSSSVNHTPSSNLPLLSTSSTLRGSDSYADTPRNDNAQDFPDNGQLSYYLPEYQDNGDQPTTLPNLDLSYGEELLPASFANSHPDAAQFQYSQHVNNNNASISAYYNYGQSAYPHNNETRREIEDANDADNRRVADLDSDEEEGIGHANDQSQGLIGNMSTQGAGIRPRLAITAGNAAPASFASATGARAGARKRRRDSSGDEDEDSSDEQNDGRLKRTRRSR